MAWLYKSEFWRIKKTYKSNLQSVCFVHHQILIILVNNYWMFGIYKNDFFKYILHTQIHPV